MCVKQERFRGNVGIKWAESREGPLDLPRKSLREREGGSLIARGLEGKLLKKKTFMP